MLYQPRAAAQAASQSDRAILFACSSSAHAASWRARWANASMDKGLPSGNVTRAGHRTRWGRAGSAGSGFEPSQQRSVPAGGREQSTARDARSPIALRTVSGAEAEELLVEQAANIRAIDAMRIVGNRMGKFLGRRSGGFADG